MIVTVLRIVKYIYLFKNGFMAIKKITKEDAKESITEKRKTSQDGQESKIRPSRLDDFAGQGKLKKNLKIFLQSAKQRKEPIEHVLFSGPPGLGKTTLSRIIALEMGGDFKISSGPALEKAGDLAAILTNVKEGDVFFIDEIHRLRSNVEEILYTAMEDYCLDLVIGKGPGARTMRIKIPKFTLVGATTRSSLLSSPLRDRFGHHLEMEYYFPEELVEIIKRTARILEIKINDESAMTIALSSRRTPRIANRLLRRVRDFAIVKGENSISKELAEKSLHSLGVDKKGLDNADRKFLKSLIEKFSGGPVGLSTLAASSSLEIGTVEEIIEPYLLQLGFLERTPRGRKATTHAFRHLGLEMVE